MFLEKKKKIGTLKYNFYCGMNINVFWMKGQQSKSRKRRNLLGANTGREEKRHPSFSGENDKDMDRPEGPESESQAAGGRRGKLVHSSPLHRELSGRTGKNIKQEWSIRKNLVESGVHPRGRPVSS